MKSRICMMHFLSSKMILNSRILASKSSHKLTVHSQTVLVLHRDYHKVDKRSNDIVMTCLLILWHTMLDFCNSIIG